MSYWISYKVVYLSIFFDSPFENVKIVQDDNQNYFIIFSLRVYQNLRNDNLTSQNLSFPISQKVVYLSIFFDLPFENLTTVHDDNWNDFIIFTLQEYENLRNDYTTSQNLSFPISHKEVCLSIFLDLPFKNLTAVLDDNWNYFLIFSCKYTKNIEMSTQLRKICHIGFLTR